MRVQYERAGGFGGSAMRKDVTIDTADLPAHEADELHRLVQAADLSTLARSPAAASSPRARDQFRYRLTIEDKIGALRRGLPPRRAGGSAILDRSAA